MCREERMTAELEKDLWSRITVVTNRKLAVRPFLDQIEILCQKGPERILLREKDLNLPEYEKLAVEVKEICDRYQVPFYCHTYREAAVKAGTQGLQLPLSVLRETGRGSLEKNGTSAVLFTAWKRLRRRNAWERIMSSPDIYLLQTVRRAFLPEAWTFWSRSAGQFPCRSTPSEGSVWSRIR